MRLIEPTMPRHPFATAEKTRAPSRPVPAASFYGRTLAAMDVVAMLLATILASVLTLGVEHWMGRPLYNSYEGASSLRHNINILLAMIVLAMFWNKGLYAQRMPWWSQVQFIGKAFIFALLIDGFVSFAFRLYESRLLIAATWGMAFAFTVALRWAACRLAVRFELWTVPTVIVADNMVAADLIYAFDADPCAGYKVRSVILRDRDTDGFDVDHLPVSCRHLQIHDGKTDAASYVRRNPHYFYAVSLDAFRGETRDALMQALEDTGASYAIMPSIARAGMYEMEPRYFFGHDIMMLQSRGTAAQAFSPGRFFKRALDVAIALSIMICAAPFMAIAALALKIEGQGGSFLYGGERIGQNGQRFKCLKIRSMEPNSDHLLHAYLASDAEAKAMWDTYHKLENDPRVTTRTARLIRKLSIDELPQVWNVLKGEMSIVGPRPILESEVADYGEGLKDYLMMRPGVTGLWQVSGRNATSFARRAHWDRWYVRNWSFWNDIVIMIKTPFALLSRKGAH